MRIGGFSIDILSNHLSPEARAKIQSPLTNQQYSDLLNNQQSTFSIVSPDVNSELNLKYLYNDYKNLPSQLAQNTKQRYLLDPQKESKLAFLKKSIKDNTNSQSKPELLISAQRELQPGFNDASDNPDIFGNNVLRNSVATPQRPFFKTLNRNFSDLKQFNIISDQRNFSPQHTQGSLKQKDKPSLSINEREALIYNILRNRKTYKNLVKPDEDPNKLLFQNRISMDDPKIQTFNTSKNFNVNKIETQSIQIARQHLRMLSNEVQSPDFSNTMQITVDQSAIHEKFNTKIKKISGSTVGGTNNKIKKIDEQFYNSSLFHIERKKFLIEKMLTRKDMSIIDKTALYSELFYDYDVENGVYPPEICQEVLAHIKKLYYTFRKNQKEGRLNDQLSPKQAQQSFSQTSHEKSRKYKSLAYFISPSTQRLQSDHNSNINGFSVSQNLVSN